MIGIINYKAGNSHSVVNACKKIGIDCKYISTAEDFTDVSAIILPGVGSAKATMNSLQELNIISKLEEYVLGKKIPFLGISDCRQSGTRIQSLVPLVSEF